MPNKMFCLLSCFSSKTLQHTEISNYLVPISNWTKLQAATRQQVSYFLYPSSAIPVTSLKEITETEQE